MTKLITREHYAFISRRAAARRLAMQSLYRWCLTGEEIAVIAADFRADRSFGEADAEHFEHLLNGCMEHRCEIEQIAGKVIGYPLRNVDPIEQVIIRSAVYEMLFFCETDRAVVIAEAVRLARKFGAAEGYRFVNGVLDHINERE